MSEEIQFEEIPTFKGHVPETNFNDGKAIDWDSIQREYEASKHVSFTELGRKYKVHPEVISRKVKKEKWELGKNWDEVEKKVRQASVKAHVKRATEAMDILWTAGKGVINVAMRRLKPHMEYKDEHTQERMREKALKNPMDNRGFADVSRAMKIGGELLCQGAGIDPMRRPVDTEEAQELAREDLERAMDLIEAEQKRRAS